MLTQKTKVMNLLACGILSITFIGQGLMNSAGNGNIAQERLMARRAAIVDVYRQAGGSQGLQIIKEVFDGHIYQITAVRRS